MEIVYVTATAKIQKFEENRRRDLIRIRALTAPTVRPTISAVEISSSGDKVRLTVEVTVGGRCSEIRPPPPQPLKPSPRPEFRSTRPAGRRSPRRLRPAERSE